MACKEPQVSSSFLPRRLCEKRTVRMLAACALLPPIDPAIALPTRFLVMFLPTAPHQPSSPKGEEKIRETHS